MNINPTLSLPRTLQMQVGSKALLSTRCLATAGMPILIVQAVNINARVIRFNPEASPLPEAITIGGFPVVALEIKPTEPGEGYVDLTWTRPWESAGNEDGFKHRIQVQTHPADSILPSLEGQIADQLSEAPSPTKNEVSAFLDLVDGSRPYGGKKVSLVNTILDHVGRSVAMHRALSCTHDGPQPSIDTLISDKAMVVLAAMRFDRYRLRDALDRFIAGRMTR